MEIGFLKEKILEFFGTGLMSRESDCRIFKEIGNGKDKEDEFDGWYYRNGTPLSSSIPAYFVKP